jgi:hypothetical protein
LAGGARDSGDGMHVRIQERRERVLAVSEPPPITPDIASILELLDKIESQITEFQAAIDDDRLPGLATVVRSVRLLVEISQFNSLISRDLMPAAGAALFHARTVLNRICVEMSFGLSGEDDQAAQPPHKTSPTEQLS